MKRVLVRGGLTEYIPSLRITTWGDGEGGSEMKRIPVLVVLLTALFIPVQAGENDLFPEVQGWKMKIDERVYNSGNLWELIDGAADIFLSYYFQNLKKEYMKELAFIVFLLLIIMSKYFL